MGNPRQDPKAALHPAFCPLGAPSNIAGTIHWTIRHAMSAATRQIEDERTEAHEVLARDPDPVLIGSEWLLRAGSGAG